MVNWLTKLGVASRKVSAWPSYLRKALSTFKNDSITWKIHRQLIDSLLIFRALTPQLTYLNWLTLILGLKGADPELYKKKRALLVFGVQMISIIEGPELCIFVSQLSDLKMHFDQTVIFPFFGSVVTASFSPLQVRFHIGALSYRFPYWPSFAIVSKVEKIHIKSSCSLRYLPLNIHLPF